MCYNYNLESSIIGMATTISQSSQPSKRENKLARSLVHPDKQIRDKTFNALIEYCRGVKQLTDLEMLKLWKSLYYCMWLADKREVQEELANSFASLIGDFRTNKLRLLFVQMFFRILLREWPLLDLHRMNKFYYLIRVIVRKALQISFEQLPKTDFAEELNNVLYTEALTQRPNGIRFHISDLFLSELLIATKNSCNTEFFMLSIAPFIKFLSEGDENVVMDRVGKSIIQSYAESYAREMSSTDNSSTGFSNVDTRVIQAKLFDLASAETTGDRYRSRLYSLHKLLANATGLDFVDMQILSANVADESNNSNLEDTKKENKKKRRADVVESSPTDDIGEGKKKKKKKATA